MNREAAMKISTLLLLSSSLYAQDTIRVNQHVTREIATGATHAYSIQLNAGDYVSGSLTQQGRASIVLFLPGGALLRRFPAPPGNGTRQFAFSAEGTGAYRIELA